jgi:hypothetical protein
MTATYIYAVIPTGDRGVFDVAGLGGDNDEVYTVPHNNIAAVVSASPLADYQGLQRNDTVPYLVAHQRVIETVMQDYPLLPVKFGTVLPDEDTARRLLAQGETLFCTNLEKFAGLLQMEVVVLWDLQQVFEEIGQEEPIAQLKAQVVGRPPEETIIERVVIGQMAHASLEQRRAALQDRLLRPLREIALDLVVNPCMDDSMVTNMALLVNADGRQALDKQLELLDQELGGKFTFRRVGPLPPYSFATVEVQVPSFEMVDAARRRLELGETAALDEIKDIYRQLAGRFHPDRNLNDPGAEARMAELTQAYKFLAAYANSQAMVGDAEGNGGPAVCRLDRQTVEQTLLIAIQRQEMMG